MSELLQEQLELIKPSAGAGGSGEFFKSVGGMGQTFKEAVELVKTPSEAGKIG